MSVMARVRIKVRPKGTRKKFQSIEFQIKVQDSEQVAVHPPTAAQEHKSEFTLEKVKRDRRRRISSSILRPKNNSLQSYVNSIYSAILYYGLECRKFSYLCLVDE